MNRIVLSSLATAVTVATVIHISSPASAQAHQCKTRFITAKAQQEGRARMGRLQRQARLAWSGRVKNKYGLPWSVWKIATAKSMNCGHWQGISTCTIKAKPCRYAVQ